MKNLVKILFFLLVLSNTSLMAQSGPPGPGGGGGGGGNPPCFPPPCVPIDGGLSWLLIAGTLYGGKKVYDLNNQTDTEG